MNIDAKRDGETVTVVVDKSISASDVEMFKQEFKGFMADGVKNITLDCGQVEIIDSIGIGLLVATHNSLKSGGGQLEIIKAPEDVHRLLTTMRLDKHFAITPA